MKVLVCVCVFTAAPEEAGSGAMHKPSFQVLEGHYKELNARKIKDSLSSFLPDMPGEVYGCVVNTHTHTQVTV